jgi:hypothetical protein
MYSFLSAIITSFFLAITRNSDAFFNYPARIETLSIAFPVSTFSSVIVLAESRRWGHGDYAALGMGAEPQDSRDKV